MLLKRVFYSLLFIFLLLAGGYLLQDRRQGTGTDKNTQYELQGDWLHLPDSLRLGNPTGIALDTAGDIFIFHRARREWPLIGSMPDDYIPGKTVLLIDKETGELKEAWGENFFIMPHGLSVDKDNNVWVTDVGRHQVFKFSHEGHLLMQVGESKMPGTDAAHFNRPTDVAVAADGSFYVSDGYGNSRVVKFSATGKYILEWGINGDKDGEFAVPHSIDLDPFGNVYVADRENNRIQVFTGEGKFLKQYAARNFGAVTAVVYTRDGLLYATDDLSFLKIKHRGSDVLVLDTAGTVHTRFGRSGGYVGETSWYHDIAVDEQANIYVCDILGNRVQKFKRVSSR